VDGPGQLVAGAGEAVGGAAGERGGFGVGSEENLAHRPGELGG
jgi:hypothetical protein